VCKAAALEQLRGARLRRPLRVVGTWAEEIGMLGTRALVASGGTRGFRHALVGEPSELVAIRAHKGYGVYHARIARAPLPTGQRGQAVEYVLQGESAHSSTPHLGRNAIELALDRLAESDVQGVVLLEGGSAVNQVPARCTLRAVLADPAAHDAPVASFDCAPLLGFHRAWREVSSALRVPANADFDPPYTVGNLGRAILADGAVEITFDLRLVAGADGEGALARLGRFAKIECARTNPPLATAPDALLVQAMRAAQGAVGLAERVGTKATSTEAGLLSAAGLETLVIGPGVSVGNVHKPNEHTSIAQLAQARDLYREVVQRLCVESPPCSS